MYLLGKLSKVDELEFMIPKKIKSERIQNGESLSMRNLKMTIRKIEESSYGVVITDTKKAEIVELSPRYSINFGEYYVLKNKGYFSLQVDSSMHACILGLEFKGDPQMTKVLAYILAYFLFETTDNDASNEISEKYGI